MLHVWPDTRAGPEPFLRPDCRYLLFAGRIRGPHALAAHARKLHLAAIDFLVLVAGLQGRDDAAGAAAGMSERLEPGDGDPGRRAAHRHDAGARDCLGRRVLRFPLAIEAEWFPGNWTALDMGGAGDGDDSRSWRHRRRHPALAVHGVQPTRVPVSGKRHAAGGRKDSLRIRI